MSQPQTSELLIKAISQVKTDVDREFALVLDHKIAAAGRLDPQYRKLMVETKKLGLRGGKRLRPFMVWLGWRLGGGDKQGNSYANFLHLAVAWEIYHLSAVILDDIMDLDTQRHHGLNIAGTYERAIKRSHDEATTTKHARNAALMSGIATMMIPLEVIRGLKIAPEIRDRLEDEFLKMHFRLVGGQFIEDQATLTRQLKPAQIRKIYLNKTSYYSVISPLQSGAIMAGANDTILKVLEKYGQHAGIAYQIIDDVLGVFGSTRDIGKPNTSDLEQGKQTLLMHYGFEFADDTQRTILSKYFGKPEPTAADLKLVRRVLTENGAKAKTLFVAQAEAEAAKQAFGKLALPGDLPDLFNNLTDYLVNRKV